jgi:putative ABC transport system permease protein
MTAMRDGLRRLRHQPGFAVVTAITMALGVAAATVLFSLVYGVLLKPLPWPDAARLVKVSESRIGATRQFPGALTNGTYLAWSEHPATLDAIGAWSQDDVTLTANPGAPERVHVMNVTPSLLGLLHARPFIGSLFAPGDERPGRPPVVLLSHGPWQRRFGGDPLVVGRPVRLDGDACTVLGVMPEDFAFPDREAQAWRPFYVPPVVGENPDQRHLSLFQALGRLRADVTPAQAAAEGTARAAEAPDLNLVGVAVFGANGPAVVSAVPVLDAMTAGVRQPLLLFLAAVGLLVATATANIASLQLARATSRRRETAIRAALGASGGKLAAPVLIESALVGLCGGLAGLGLAVGLVRLLPALLPAGFPRLDAVAVDGTVAAFAVAVSLLSALVFGLAPVLLSRGVNLVESLAEDGLAPSGGGARTAASRARRLIIVGQVAIATVLLVGGLLLARSFAALLAADRGYQPASVLTAELPLPDETYDGLRRSALLDRTLDRLRALPGVRAAAAGTGSPLMTFAGPFRQGMMLKAFTMPSVTGEGPVSVQASVRLVSAGWFHALGTRLVEGRAFGATDTRTSAPVVVVNRAFARRYLADRAVDRTLPIGADGAPDVRVVGVVEDIHQGSITDPVQPELYLPYRQQADGFSPPQASIVLRTDGDPSRYAAELRRLIRSEDDGLALGSTMTLQDRLSASLAEPRLYALLLVAFGVSALLVAGVGLFAVLSYGVAQRAREIGVRSALGARPTDIVRLVVSQAVGMTAAGIVAGMLVAAALVRVLATLLYGVGPYDITTFLVVAAVLLLVAALAAAGPARRAARVDPIKVLRV